MRVIYIEEYLYCSLVIHGSIGQSQFMSHPEHQEAEIIEEDSFLNHVNCLMHTSLYYKSLPWCTI